MKKTTKKSELTLPKVPITVPIGTLPAGGATSTLPAVGASLSPGSSGGTTPAGTAPAVAAPQPVTAVSRSKSHAKALVVNAMIALIAGLRANFSPTDVLDLPSGTYTIEELIAAFTAYLALVTDVTTASQAYHGAVENERTGSKSALTLRSQVKVAIESRVGKTSNAMAAYGFPPAKVPVRTAKSKMTAVVKSEATRVARGTKGSVQKEAITGNVTGIGITSIVAATASAIPGTAAAGSTPAAPVATPASATHS